MAAARLKLIVPDEQDSTSAGVPASDPVTMLPSFLGQSAPSSSTSLTGLWRQAFLPPLFWGKGEVLRLEGEIIPEALWLGDPERGRRIISREFPLEGLSIHFEREFDWSAQENHTEWSAALHGFEWLGDVRSYNDTVLSAHRMREYILDWIDHAATHPLLAHYPEVTGLRLAAWLQHAVFLRDGADEYFLRRFEQSLARQALGLWLRVRRMKGNAGFMALRGLCFAACTLPAAAPMLSSLEEFIYAALQRRLLPDGGHISRSQGYQVKLLAALLDIRGLLEKQGRSEAALNRAIHHVAAMLQLFRMSDGRVGLFHDTVEVAPGLVEALLDKVRIPENEQIEGALHSGFQKLSAMGTDVLMDTGFSEKPHRRSHLSPLAFEMSSGADRLIVNCGAYHGADERWRKACRSTPAHSLLHLEGVDAWGKYDSPAEMRVPATPIVKCSRFTESEVIGIEASHNGFVDRSGLIYRRRLTLSKDGKRLSGEEFLSPEPGYRFMPGHAVRLRFHLHPSVKVVRVEEGMIRLQAASGARWKFKCSLPRVLSVEDSVYLGHDGAPETTSQILISCDVSRQEWSLEWNLVQL